MTAKQIRLDEAHDYLDRIIGALHDLSAEKKGPLLKILEYLSGHIRDTRSEVAMLRRTHTDTQALSSTTDELEEIVHETARATNAIMDAAESIEQVSQQVPAEAATSLQEAATRIYEACSFQDITGQRIEKIVQAFRSLEEHIVALAEACDDESASDDVAAKAEDAALLNGPQLSSHANSQSEIDRLFDDL